MNTILLIVIILLLLLRRDRCELRDKPVTLTLANVRSNHNIAVSFRDREAPHGEVHSS